MDICLNGHFLFSNSKKIYSRVARGAAEDWVANLENVHEFDLYNNSNKYVVHIVEIKILYDKCKNLDIYINRERE